MMQERNLPVSPRVGYLKVDRGRPGALPFMVASPPIGQGMRVQFPSGPQLCNRSAYIEVMKFMLLCLLSALLACKVLAPDKEPVYPAEPRDMIGTTITAL